MYISCSFFNVFIIRIKHRCGFNRRGFGDYRNIGFNGIAHRISDFIGTGLLSDCTNYIHGTASCKNHNRKQKQRGNNTGESENYFFIACLLS